MHRSLSTIKADLARKEYGITGRDVVWAVVSTGIDARHSHFSGFRNLELPAPLGHFDYSTLQETLETHPELRRALLFGDDTGDSLLDDRYVVHDVVDSDNQGTAIAGVIAGQSQMDDLSMQGIVPQARLASFKVFGKGPGSEFNVIAALRAIQQINQNAKRVLIHGVVVPLAVEWDYRNYACGHSPVCVEVDRLVNSGVVVVTAAGNSFDAEARRVVVGGITDPGNADLAITVGASHRTSPQIYGASYFSSRGPTADGRRKPDLLAPGEKIQVCAPSDPPEAPPARSRPRPKGAKAKPGDEPKTNPATPVGYYTRRDGTDVAAAHVAGAAAALMAVRPDLIGKPHEIKHLLLTTAVDLHREVMYQGAGLLDVLAAVRAAAGAAGTSRTAAKPLKVFCSYSHLDQALWKEFKAHLSPMQKAGRIEIWSDLMLEGGQRWKAEIDRKLEEADIILLLVSSYFVESEFCYSIELKRAVEREAEGTARMIPVRVRPVSLKGTVLADIQALPPGAQPITSFKDPHDGWTQVADNLYDIVEKLAARKA
jgi:subtilisin family serine protease